MPRDLYVEDEVRVVVVARLGFFLGNIDKAGPGKFFVMVYGLTDDQQLQPILIPIQICSLPSNQMRISFSPPTVGTYRIYIAYRNLPINGE